MLSWPMLTVSAASTVFAANPCTPGTDQGGINLGDCLQLSDSTLVSERYNSLSFLVNLIVRNLFVVGGLVLFAMLLLSAFKMITGGKKGADEAKTIATTSLIGFVVMFCAYWIVQLIKFLTKTNIPL